MKKIFVYTFILILMPFCIHAVNPKYDVNELKPQQSSSGKWGYQDDNGRFKIKPQFELAMPFKEGLAVISVCKKYGFIDIKGRPVIRPQFEDARNFCDGLAAVMIYNQKMLKKWGYIDKRGQFIIDAKFDDATDFCDGSATVTVADKTYIIDKSGTVIEN